MRSRTAALPFSRRQALAAGASLPLAAAAASLARPAHGAAEMMGLGVPQFYRFGLGGFEVTTLLAGTRTVPDPQTIFGLNVPPEEFAEVSDAAFIPADKAQFFFTPTLVNTGTELILFDTGLDAAGITGPLQAAGYAPDQVDVVVLTHMHGDHIGGMMSDGAPTFPNARYVTGSVEHNHWSGAGNEGFETNVAPMNDQMSFIGGGDTVASGVTAMEAFGHTPGHMAFMLESEGERLALIADAANHYVWSVGHPDWEVRFDMDKEAAAATRRELFGMLAADRVPFVGYHMPFPAMGFVEAQGDGFRYVPVSYQMMLDD
jgi:glyoxylase-like metal-dependent hydrolase (beta-lactamase superfamily II)